MTNLLFCATIQKWFKSKFIWFLKERKVLNNFCIFKFVLFIMRHNLWSTWIFHNVHYNLVMSINKSIQKEKNRFITKLWMSISNSVKFYTEKKIISFHVGHANQIWLSIRYVQCNVWWVLAVNSVVWKEKNTSYFRVIKCLFEICAWNSVQ